MNRKIRIAVVVLIAMWMAGCCTCRERYEPALKEWDETLKALRPTFEKGALTLPEPLNKSKLTRYDRLHQGVKRVRGEGPEVFATGGAE